MHRTTLGDFELTVITDGLYYLDGGAMFGVVPKPLWEKKLPADAQNRLHVAMNSLAIRTGDHTILIDTGAGNKLPGEDAPHLRHRRAPARQSRCRRLCSR